MHNLLREVAAFYPRPSSIQFRNPFCRCGNWKNMSTLQHRLPCGCTFCDHCFTHDAINSISIKCPVHKVTSDLTKVKSIELKAENILEMEAYCKNRAAGCNHISTVKELEHHEKNECCYSIVDCPLKCGSSVYRRDFIHHFASVCSKRVVKCTYCDTDIMYYTEQSHHETCSKVKVKCEFCGDYFIRYELPRHHETCGEKPVHCKFRQMGCDFTGKRINISLHESLEKHSDLFLSSFMEFKKELKKEVKRQRESLNKVQELKDTIESMRDELNNSIEDTGTSLEDLKMEMQRQRNSLTEEVKVLKDTIEPIKEQMTEMTVRFKNGPEPSQGFPTLSGDHGITLTSSSAQNQAFSFREMTSCSTPKSKETQVKRIDEPQVKEMETQVERIDEKLVEEMATMEPNTREIVEESTHQVEENSARCSNRNPEFRRRKIRPSHCHPITPSTNLIYSRGMRRVTIFAWSALAVLLLMSISYNLLL